MLYLGATTVYPMKVIILLTGENEFEVQKEKRRIIDAFLKEHDAFGLEQIDAVDAEPERFRDALLQLPFLVARKLVIINDSFVSKPAQEKLLDLYEQIPGEIDLVLVDTKPDKRTKLYKTLQSHKQIQEFDALKGLSLTRWVEAYTKELGSTISGPDAEYLIDRVGTNQMMLARELEKLAIDSLITKDVIGSRTERHLQATIFELLDAVFSGNDNRTLEIYDELLVGKTDPSEIIALISWQLNIFATVIYSGSTDSGEIARKTKIHPYVVGKALKVTKNMSKQDLKIAVGRVLDADLRIKTSPSDPEDVLRVLLLKLTSL